MAENVKSDTSEIVKKCGIIMPISAHADYPADHWKDVLNIIKEAINETNFKPNLVSDDEAIGLIHERIVTNIYSNEIIVCDVSSKNPNVMFELGLRLAFDKPVIIIKDDRTSYTFDTGVIEHITYPASLRFADIVNFKRDLAKRIDSTYNKSLEENFSPFLKSFGKTIVPSKINNQEVSETKFLIEQVNKMRDDFQKMRYELKNSSISNQNFGPFIGLKKKITGYMSDIISKQGRVSYKDLVNVTKNNFKIEHPEIDEGLINKLVNDVFDEPVWS